MRAIIPVAGFGSRLRPHTHTVPKVLLNVGGKPIIGHIIEQLLMQNITKATFIYGHLGEQVIKYVNTEYPQLQADFVEQATLEGLGHAIYLAGPTFDDDELLITLGDTIFDVSLSPVFEQKTSSLGVKEVEDPSRFGVALLENSVITKLIEKPQEPVSKLALVGLYYITNRHLLLECLETLITNNIRTRGEYQLTDALQLMIERGETMTTFTVDGWYDCGKPETLLQTNRFLLGRNGHSVVHEGSVINQPVFIHPEARVINSIIGPNTTIDSNAIIENSIIENSIVGSNSYIKNGLLDDSIIGANSQIIGAKKKLNSGDSTEIDFF